MKRRRSTGRSAGRSRTRLLLEQLESRVVMDGAAANDVQVPSDAADTLRRFESAEELKDYLLDNAVDQWKKIFGTQTPAFFRLDDRLEHDAFFSRPAFQDLTFAVDARHTGTNVQVAGIDEGDLVKTDGEYLYLARDSRLLIVDVRYPAEMEIVGRITLDAPITELYVSGDRLTAVSANYFQLMAFDYLQLPVAPPSLEVNVFDISDRDSPNKLQEFKIEGSLVQSRQIGGNVILVTNHSVTLPAPELKCDTPAEESSTDDSVMLRRFGTYHVCTYETEAEYVARYADKVLDLTLPEYFVNGSETPAGLLAPVTELAADVDSPSTLTSVVVLDVGAETPSIVDSAGLLTVYSSQVYVSESSVYVAGQHWAESGGTTHITKFSLGENQDSVSLTATGEVDGHLLNRFSMDEHEGYLRVATTESWGADATNNVFVLQASDESLVTVGSLTEIAQGESIFAARFLGDVGYLVTFRQIDPLIAMDLSDPANPKIEGELKIPGFSNYLHPLPGGFVIGLGRDADPQTGQQGDSQISLFNVSDLSDPKLIDRLSLPGGGSSWSPAFSDHHAISFFEESRILAIPFSFYETVVIPGFNDLVLEFDSSDLKQVVADLPEDYSVEDAARLLRQYLPDSWDGVLTSGIPSLEEFKEFISQLPDEVDLQEVLDRLREFAEETVADFHGGVVTAEELEAFVADLPEDVRNLVADLRDRLPRFVERLRNRGEGESQPVRSGMWLFRVNPAAGDPLSLIGTIAHDQLVDRSVRIENTLFTISHDMVKAHDLEHPDRELGQIYVGRFTFNDYTTVDLEDESVSIDVLSNDRGKEDLVIAAVTQPANGGSVSISEDGKLVIYTPPEEVDDTVGWYGSDTFQYSVTVDGQTEVADVRVQFARERAGRRMTELAKKAVAEKLDIAIERIETVFVSPRWWANTCLEIPTDGACTTGPVAGFLVQLIADGNYYFFHTDTESTVILAETAEAHPTVLPDYYTVSQNSEATELRVLENDFHGLAFIRAPEITSVSTPSEGGRVTIGEGNRTVLYTPAADFNGTESFTYTVDGGATATVTVDVRPELPANDGSTKSPMIDIRIDITDLEGQPVTEVGLGDQFVINIYVKDLSAAGLGVFSTYVDLEFDTSLAVGNGAFEFANEYNNGVSGEFDRTGINEIGGFAGSIVPLSTGEKLLVSIPMEAVGNGTLTVRSNSADLHPSHDYALYGNDFSVSPRRVRFGSAEIQIVNPFHDPNNPTDSNGDGITSPLDAMPLINWINEFGAASVKQLRASSRFAIASGESGGRRNRFDTNGDGFCTPIDVLMIFNRVNQDIGARLAGQGEAESAPLPLSLNAPSDSTVLLVGPDAPVNTSAGDGILIPSASSEESGSDEETYSCPDEIDSLIDELVASSSQVSPLDEIFAEL